MFGKSDVTTSVRRQIGIVALIAIGFAAVYVEMAPGAAKRRTGIPGFDELVPCAFLTSIDSKKSLYLSGHHDARISENTGTGTNWASGTWSLIDDERHEYLIDIDGTRTSYTLVSAPEGEGCMLVAGRLDAADLNKSWFSALTDPK